METTRHMWLPATKQYSEGKTFEYEGKTYRVINSGRLYSLDGRRLYCLVAPICLLNSHV